MRIARKGAGKKWWHADPMVRRLQSEFNLPPGPAETLLLIFRNDAASIADIERWSEPLYKNAAEISEASARGRIRDLRKAVSGLLTIPTKYGLSLTLHTKVAKALHKDDPID